VITIHNPIIDENMIRKASSPVSHPWFQPDQPPVILGAGRLEKQKNFPLLISSFEIVRRKKTCRLMILGNGREFDDLQSTIAASRFSSDINLAGHCDNPYSFMRRSSLFVLSSSWEGLPTVLVEALGTGTPVVSTDCPSGPREILMNGKFGRLVPENSPESLARAMLESLEDPPSAEYLKQRAAAFDVHHSADKYLKLFGLAGEG
jgi:glycosyltransferase involved in cell wall biosynthesis